MKLPALTIGLFAILSSTAIRAQTIFSQNFSSGSTLSTYFSASTPDANQFNSISSSGSGTVASISSGALSFARTANAGAFSRTTDFSTVPAALLFQFDLSVSGNSTASTNVAAFQVGSGFGTTNSTETNSLVHSRIGVNFTATAGTFSLRDIGATTNSTSLSGVQTVRWYINNTGASFNYTGPDSSVYALANDTAQLWAGTTRLFSSIGATTVSQTLTDFKFAFSGGTGTILIDNIELSAIPEPSSFSVLVGVGIALATVTRRRRAAL